MKLKPLIIILVILVALAGIAATAFFVGRSYAIGKVSDMLAQKLEPLGMHADIVPAPATSEPTCLDSLTLTGPEGMSVELVHVCIAEGLTTLRSDAPKIRVECSEVRGKVPEEAIRSLRTRMSERKDAAPPGEGGSASRLAKMEADVRVGTVEVQVGSAGRSATWRSNDATATLAQGKLHLATSAPLAIDLAKAPFAIRNMPQIAVTADADVIEKTANVTIAMEPAIEIGASWKGRTIDATCGGATATLHPDRSIEVRALDIGVQAKPEAEGGTSWKDSPITATLASAGAILRPDRTIDADVSGIAAKIDSLPMLEDIRVERVQATMRDAKPSLESFSGLRIVGPSVSVNLPMLLALPAIANAPFVGALLQYWKQDAGSLLGSAPRKSVRRADVEKSRERLKTVRANPISPEKLRAVREVFDKIQKKIAALPAVDIQNGHVEIVQGENRFSFDAISFNTAELVKDSQKFALEFNVREATAKFNVSYPDASPYPTIEFQVDRLASADFLRILNLPIPEHNAGTFSMSITASMSDADFSLRGDLALDDFAFYHPKVSPNVVQHIDASTQFTAVYDFAKDSLSISPFTASSGPVTATGFIRVSRVRSEPLIEFEIGAQDIPCADIPKAIPEGFLPTITDLQIAGTTFSPKISATIPWKTPLNSQIDTFNLPDTCYPVSVEPHRPEILNDPNYTFTTDYTYFTDSITVGPGTKSYVPLSQIPPYVVAAMYLTEDKRMFEHGPLSHTFIERALRLNLNARSYVYGGSTILQQLTKNLFLRRTKNLARKLEEAFIAWRIDFVVPKRRVMELYINMIEFGPDMYGISSAADFYFNKKPSQLTPVEGAYLASLKIAPSKGGRCYRQKTVGPESWWHKKIRAIMNNLAENGYISVQEAIAGYPWLPEFYYSPDPHDYRNVWIKNYDAMQRAKSQQKHQQQAAAQNKK